MKCSGLSPHVPEALKNTIAIAERCNFEITLGEYKFPNFTPPEGKINQELFRGDEPHGP